MVSPKTKARTLVRKLVNYSPVDLQEAANKMDLEYPVQILWNRPLPEGVSVLVLKARKQRICYICNNEDETEERKRYNTALELGHIALGNTNPNSPELDQQADEYATELLLPYRPLCNLAKRITNPIELINQAHVMFKASLEACSRRLTDLEFIKGEVMLFQPNRIFFHFKAVSLEDNDLSIFNIAISEYDTLMSKKIFIKPILGTNFRLYLQNLGTGQALAILAEPTEVRCPESLNIAN